MQEAWTEAGQSGGRVAVIDDDEAIRRVTSSWLSKAGYAVVTFENGELGMRALGREFFDAVCLDITLPGIDGFEVLRRIRQHQRHLAVVMMTGEKAVESVVSAVQLGAFDYLSKPLDKAKLLTTVRNAVGHTRLSARLYQLERHREGRYPEIRGSSPSMERLFRDLDLIAPWDLSILILGESGTGKELIAKAIHDHSGRADGPFVAINCAAIPDSLQESELFGHERGAYTGATSQRKGRFEQADGGTLFLDEIAELNPGSQAKLLRVLEQQVFYRVGGTTEISSNFRIVAATHRNLREATAAEFRHDLFYRLAAFELLVPPLREREGDVALLARYFIRELRGDRPGGDLTKPAFEALEAHSWPGNVRELRNAIQHGVVLAGDGPVDLEHLPHWVPHSKSSPRIMAPSSSPSLPAVTSFGRHPSGGRTLKEIEREAILDSISRHDGNIAKAATELDVARSTLYRKLRAYGIEV